LTLDKEVSSEKLKDDKVSDYHEVKNLVKETVQQKIKK